MLNRMFLYLCVSAFILHITSKGITVTCENNTRSLSSIRKPVYFIKCLNCNIPILDETTVAVNFRGDTFNISNSHVRKIKAGAFNTFLNNTHNFIFQNNEIDYIEPKAFNRFNAIDLLNLQNCKISFLETKVFEDTTLSTLDLSFNRLSNISSIFDGLKVNKLNLSNNAIRELSESTFDKVTFSLGRQWRNPIIDLSKNSIEKLIPNTFKSPNKDDTIKNLILNKNSISTIENNTFSQLNYLDILSLEDNQISVVYRDSFKGLTGLYTLNLKNNLISDIPAGLFGDLGYLQTLDLSNNRLTSLTQNTFSGLLRLYNLNISHNDLRAFDESYLFPLGQLLSLDVSSTKLHELKLDLIIEHHFRLRVVVLNDNFWTCKNLVHMYKFMNRKSGGFDYPSRHFDVPNLHGIACSRVELDSYDNLSFDDFLSVISQDHVFEDVYDSRLNQEAEINLSDIKNVIGYINNINYMFTILIVISMVLFIYSIFKCVIMYLSSQNIIKTDKFSFAYAQNQDNVELLR